ncbi:sulfite exporter TauE/SafE family protein [Sulfurospirillum arsenophilum]|uniref:sulfite exporter TauE/SafE family protein n=1 Tax=Sulfurospirillum arsenophilum TaxID=56698 RepID=UPI0005AA1204|nr:sulfite exporter TauE/SafE family protein [Sulfurospirillum arsenophilum]
MEIFLVAGVAFIASLLTFFSGFGLGTLLMPIIVLFFPLPIAIAITAIVHFSNNLLKFFLLVKHSDVSILLRFGVPAVIFALLGAWSLDLLSEWSLGFTYTLFGFTCNVTPLKLIIGLVIVFFLILESSPTLRVPNAFKKLWLGGALSGFFGGLSGNQGAFRSLFLTQNALSKEVFLATGVSIAVIVDLSRLSLYAKHWESALAQWELIVIATLSAFIGTLIGKFFLKKVSIEFIRFIVAWMLGVVAFLLIAGVL